MTKTIGYCVLICAVTFVGVVAMSHPTALSDEHRFLAGFVGNELLAVLGVILAITIAAAAQLHLSLNSIEERVGAENLFPNTRRGLQSSVHWLIALFVVAILLVVVKPFVAGSATGQSLVNGTALVLLLWNALILLSISSAVFGVKPVIDGD